MAAWQKKLIIDEILKFEVLSESTFSDKSKYQTFLTEGGATFSNGLYAKKKCTGDRTIKEGKLIQLKSICEFVTSSKQKFWVKVGGEDRFLSTGIGYFTIIDGTGTFKDIIGKKCTYALSFFDNLIFSKGSCDLDINIYDRLIEQ